MKSPKFVNQGTTAQANVFEPPGESLEAVLDAMRTLCAS